jgi:hypothetical protein
MHNISICFYFGAILTEVFLNLTEVFLTLTEVFPCFFLICKANARVKLAKTGHGPRSSTVVVIYVVCLLLVLFYVLFVGKCVLPPGDNPTAVNKYIISYINTLHVSDSLSVCHQDSKTVHAASGICHTGPVAAC